MRRTADGSPPSGKARMTGKPTRGPRRRPAARMIAIGVAVIAVAFAGAAAWYLNRGDDSPRADATDVELVTLGAQVYVEHCASCHGRNLEGEPNWRYRRADGTLPAPPHDETGHTWHHSDEHLFRMTKEGPAAVVGKGYREHHDGLRRHPRRPRDLGEPRLHQESLAGRRPRGPGQDRREHPN